MNRCKEKLVSAKPFELENVATSSMQLTDSGDSCAEKELFQITCENADRPLPVWGFIVQYGDFITFQLAIFDFSSDDPDSCEALQPGRNTEWADCGPSEHIVLAIAAVLNQMNLRGYTLVSETSLEIDPDARSRLIFRSVI